MIYGDGCTAAIQTGLTSITSVTIPNSVTVIREKAFRDCSRLTTITIPESVKSIGVEAFSNCTSLTSVVIPNTVTSIGNRAFDVCTSLTSVILPEGIKIIDDATFGACESLTSITIPVSVTSIGTYAFRQCTSLTSVVIPNSVTSIGKQAFEYCSGLSVVTIPESVTSVGADAFNGCRLRAVRSKAHDPRSIPSSAFSAQTYAHSILYVPEGSWLDYCYDGVWYQFNDIREEISTVDKAKAEDVYMLMNSKTMSYVVYDAVNGRFAEVSSVTKWDASNLNNSWMAASVGGKMYLYNLGTRTFVRPTKDGFEAIGDMAALQAANGEYGISFSGNDNQWSLVKNEALHSSDGLVDDIPSIFGSESSIHNSEMYDLSGRKVKNARNGLYIQNGRKIAIK